MVSEDAVSELNGRVQWIAPPATVAAGRRRGIDWKPQLIRLVRRAKGQPPAMFAAS
jgi:hypothetical protein